MPTLIVEDGTCPDGANTYASLAEADSYCIDRGLWADSDGDAVIIAKKETALIRATDWLNGMDWRGAKVDPLRVMAWPRDGIVLSPSIVLDNTSVPSAVAVACIEAAALFFGGDNPLAPQEHGGDISAFSETVGPISSSITYKDSAPADTAYKAVTDRVRLFLNSVQGEMGMKMFKLARG
jgi:hypothetical protein